MISRTFFHNHFDTLIFLCWCPTQTTLYHHPTISHSASQSTPLINNHHSPSELNPTPPYLTSHKPDTRPHPHHTQIDNSVPYSNRYLADIHLPKFTQFVTPSLLIHHMNTHSNHQRTKCRISKFDATMLLQKKKKKDGDV